MNIHKDHKKLVEQFLSDEFGIGYSEEQKQKIVKIYEELNKMPKKDWDKYKQ